MGTTSTVDQGERGAMDRALHALREGAISFTAFELATRRDWTRLARMVWQRWPLPAAVGIEDVRQELLLAVVQRRESSGYLTLVEKWDPSLCSRATGAPITLARFTVWNAIVWACRWLHKQRGAHKTKQNGGSAGKEPSSFERNLSSFARTSGEGETYAVPEAVQDEEQGQAAEVDQLIAQVFRKLRSPRDRSCLKAYLEAGGSVPTVAQVLAGDVQAGMRGAPIRTEREARKAVRGSLHRARVVVRRMRSELSEERA